MSCKVCVIGAGVIGLSTALQILDALPRITVMIVSDKLTPDTTSDGAGGFWQPYLMGDTSLDKLRMWGGATFEYLRHLSGTEEAADAGIFPVSGHEIYHNKIDDPFWADQVLGYSPMSSRELQRYPGHSYGISYTTFVCQGKKYLPWLTRKIKAKGGTIIQKKISTLSELFADYDVIVNCSGLGAQELCNDKTLTPTKGQIIKVEAPWIKTFLCADDDEVYILINSDCIILGGTHEEGVESRHVNESEKIRIWNTCCKLIPSLKHAKFISDWVGFRPTRPKIRLESENFTHGEKSIKVIHNYGHGGGGITFHWGCGHEAAELVKQAIVQSSFLAKY